VGLLVESVLQQLHCFGFHFFTGEFVRITAARRSLSDLQKPENITGVQECTNGTQPLFATTASGKATGSAAIPAHQSFSYTLLSQKQVV
jgi:hypothetical protein